MTLFDWYLHYMGEVCAGKRAMPAVENPTADIPAFVRKCAEQDGKDLPEALYEQFSMEDALAAAKALTAQEASPAETETPPQEEPSAPDVDRGKHPFEVLLDCVAMDDQLVRYLIEILKNKDRTAFFKLSKVTTGLDLDPDEFLFWLGQRELYAENAEERVCAGVMDACLVRLCEEGRLEVLAALLAGDRETFEAFRCEAPELVHLPSATYEWYCAHYLDRDYPIRFLMRRGGVVFPAKKP